MPAYHNAITQSKTLGCLNRKLTKVIGHKFCSLLKILMYRLTKRKIWKHKNKVMKLLLNLMLK